MGFIATKEHYTCDLCGADGTSAGNERCPDKWHRYDIHDTVASGQGTKNTYFVCSLCLPKDNDKTPLGWLWRKKP